MTTKLSPTMIEGLTRYAMDEMGLDHSMAPYPQTRTNTALARRNLIVRSGASQQFELTHLGRAKVATLSEEFAAWWDKVKARTAKCANRWHQVCDANEGQLCPECPSEQNAPTREPADIDDLVGWVRELLDWPLKAPAQETQ